MNRRKLITLLNLYIDDEIDAEDLVHLEHALSDDAEARQLYHQYCRLDSATRRAHHLFQFRKASTTELTPGGSHFRPLGWIGRFRKVTIVAGSVAASIALVSSFLIVFGPDGRDRQTAAIASTSNEVNSAISYLSMTAPGHQSFNSDTTVFTLEPASDGTLVPAAWKPQIDLPETMGLAGRPPEAWAAGGGIQWDPPQNAKFPFAPNPRVYRGSERQSSGNFQTVSFQFQK